MFVVIVDWTVSPEAAPEFAELLKVQARNSLELEDACRIFDVAQDPDQPGCFLLYELYDSAAAFEAHLASDHFKAFAPKADAVTIEKAVRTMVRIAG